ncbi:MAG: hypothetical protein N2589_01240 [bacterium]|nr:hypothetical protein [bacterium]
MKKKSIGVFSVFLLFVSCSINKTISEKNKLYIENIENNTNQPLITFTLNENINRTFIEYPGFTLTKSKEDADFILFLRVLKFERIPIFYDKEKVDDIVGTKYQIEYEIEIKKEKNLFNKKLKESISTSISKEYKEEKVFSQISEEISKKIYFEILKFKK